MDFVSGRLNATPAVLFIFSRRKIIYLTLHSRASAKLIFRSLPALSVQLCVHARGSFFPRRLISAMKNTQRIKNEPTLTGVSFLFFHSSVGLQRRLNIKHLNICHFACPPPPPPPPPGFFAVRFSPDFYFPRRADVYQRQLKKSIISKLLFRSRRCIALIYRPRVVPLVFISELYTLGRSALR